MNYLIEGKNANDESGSWEIEADDEKSLHEILNGRGIRAVEINGETITITASRARPDESQGD